MTHEPVRACLMRMRPFSPLLLISPLFAACGPLPPPQIALTTGEYVGGRAVLTARVTHPDGTPFSGDVEFETTNATLSASRVKADLSGTAVTTMTASEGQFLIVVRAGGTETTFDVTLRPSPTSNRAPDFTLLRFRVSPTHTPVGDQLRPIPELVVERYSQLSGIISHQTAAEVPITIALTSCSATLDQRSQLSHTSIGGLATFDNIAFTTAAAGCTLTATSPGIRSAQSALFDIAR